MKTNITSESAVTAGDVSVASEKAPWHAPVLEQLQVAALTETFINNGNDGNGGMTAGTPPLS